MTSEDWEGETHLAHSCGPLNSCVMSVSFSQFPHCTVFKTGVVAHAQGSAYVELCGTKVMCSIFGPRPTNKSQFTSQGQLHCNVRVAPFAREFRLASNSALAQEASRDLSRQLYQALEAAVLLEKFPKSVVEVNAVVLEADGAVLSTVINCATLAFANAELEMHDLLCSCSAVELSGQVVLDPAGSEERFGEGAVTVAYMPSMNEVTLLRQSGEMEVDKVLEAVDLCLDGCSKVQALMRDFLVHQFEEAEEVAAQDSSSTGATT